MSEFTVEITEHDRVVTVTYGCGRANVVSEPAYASLRDAFTAQWNRPRLAAVVLRTRGTGAFVGGTDITEFATVEPHDALRRARTVRDCFWAMRDCPVPVVAVLQGAALGAGVGFVAASDIAIASSDAVLGLPEIDVGVLGGAKALATLVPPRLVRYLQMTGARIAAAEVASRGGLARVVPSDELEGALDDVLTTLRGKSVVGLRMAKKGLNVIEMLSFKDAYEYEQTLSADMMATDDSQECLRAFLERRTPVFAGQETT